MILKDDYEDDDHDDDDDDDGEATTRHVGNNDRAIISSSSLFFTLYQAGRAINAAETEMSAHSVPAFVTVASVSIFKVLSSATATTLDTQVRSRLIARVFDKKTHRTTLCCSSLWFF